MVYRVFNEEGKGQCDIIAMDDEVIEAGKDVVVYNFDPEDFKRRRTIKPCSVEKLLIPFIIDGKLATTLPTIKEKREYIKDQLEHKVWESELRPELPHQHYIDLTEKVYQVREDLYSSLHGGQI